MNKIIVCLCVHLLFVMLIGKVYANNDDRNIKEEIIIEKKELLVNSVVVDNKLYLFKSFFYDYFYSDRDKNLSILKNMNGILDDKDYYFYLGLLTYDGSKGKKQVGNEYLLKAFNLGHASAGLLLSNDLDFNKEHRRHFIKTSAQRGDSYAQYLMSTIAENNTDKADWLFLSISQGDDTGADEALRHQEWFSEEQINIIKLVSAISSGAIDEAMLVLNSISGEAFFCDTLRASSDLFILLIESEFNYSRDIRHTEKAYFDCELFLKGKSGPLTN